MIIFRLPCSFTLVSPSHRQSVYTAHALSTCTKGWSLPACSLYPPHYPLLAKLKTQAFNRLCRLSPPTSMSSLLLSTCRRSSLSPIPLHWQPTCPSQGTHTSAHGLCMMRPNVAVYFTPRSRLGEIHLPKPLCDQSATTAHHRRRRRAPMDRLGADLSPYSIMASTRVS